MNATQGKRPSAWPLLLLSLPAFVAVWSGWVGLGQMTGFGVIELLPGITDLRINTAITLPIGAEVLGVIAAQAWLNPSVNARARMFAYRLLWTAALYGAAGQAAYHLMAAAGWNRAPWPVTLGVSILPVGIIVLGLVLFHMIHYGEEPEAVDVALPAPTPIPVGSPAPVSDSVTAPDVAPEAGGFTRHPPFVLPDIPDRAVRHRVNDPVVRPESFPDRLDPASSGDRSEIVRWVASVRPTPTDRTLGAWFGKSRNWGAGILREAASLNGMHA